MAASPFSVPGDRPVEPKETSLEVSSRMVEVTVREKEDLNRALRRLRRKMIRSGLLRDMKKNRYYEKPSIVKRKKAKAAERRRRRARARRNRNR
jgi:small subunit ribosomal protein S21